MSRKPTIYGARYKELIWKYINLSTYQLWIMNGNVIKWSLKMIEVYMDGNRKEMNYDVKECENGLKMATFL